jgi:sugar phosphate isomerase/epimerase
MNRRSFLRQSSAALCAGATLPQVLADSPTPTTPRFRIGTCTLDLARALKAGLEGVEVGVGGAADRLSIAEESVRLGYKKAIAETKLPICSLMMGLLNEFPLATDPRGPAWLDQSIDAARDLGARTILIAFFGKGDLLQPNNQPKEDELAEVARRIQRAAPKAKEAGVVLAIENMLSGEQNARLLDRINHEAVQIYYDVFNTGTSKGHNVPADLKLLKGRIAQLHFKNGPKFLDEEPTKFEPIAAAVKETGYRGWVVLETSSPSGDPVADARRNGDYLRKLLA